MELRICVSSPSLFIAAGYFFLVKLIASVREKVMAPRSSALA